MQTLKSLRTANHLTQEELAHLFGVSSKTIQNVEKDSSNIRDSLLRKYIQGFSVSYDDIFLGNEYEIFEFEKREKEKVLMNLDV